MTHHGIEYERCHAIVHRKFGKVICGTKAERIGGVLQKHKSKDGDTIILCNNCYNLLSKQGNIKDGVVRSRIVDCSSY